jgi:hypothetical protein
MTRILVAATALAAALLGPARASDPTSHVMAMCPMRVAACGPGWQTRL